MKPKTNLWYWLAVILFAFAVIAGAAGLFGQTAQAQPSLCTVSGTIYKYDGTVMSKHPFQILKVKRSGYIIPVPDATVYTDSLGVVSFAVPRSNFTTHDTTKITVYINADPFNRNKERGIELIIPDAATADLSTLPVSSYSGPAGFAAVVPTVYGGTTGNIKRVDTLIVTGDGVDVTNPFGTLTLAIDGGGAAVPYGDSIRVADSLARLANERVLSPLHRDSIRVADSLARLARIEADAAADSSRLANQRADLLEAEIDTVQDAAVAQLEADMAGKQALLSAPQLARIDSMLAAGVRVTITSVGKIRVISIDTTGLMLGDMYNNLVAEVQNKLNSDTASIAAVMDAMYARSGGASVWTTGTNFVYREGGVTIGGTDSPWSYQAGVRISRSLTQPEDSSAKLGKLTIQSLTMDTLIYVSKNDSLVVVRSVVQPQTLLNRAPYTVGSVEYLVRGYRLNGSSVVGWGGFRVVSDSSAGYELAGVDVDFYGLFGGLPNHTSSRSVGQIYNNSTVGWVWAYNGSSVGVRPITPAHVNTFSSRNAIYCLIANPVNQMNYFEARLRVHYAAAPGSSSTFFVTILPQQ